MIYLVVLGVALLAVGIATPLTVLALRFLDKPTTTPAKPPVPAIMEISGPERIEQIAQKKWR